MISQSNIHQDADGFVQNKHAQREWERTESSLKNILETS
jgi:hypothetical protein